MRKAFFIMILLLLSLSGINLYAQGVSSAAAIFLRLPIGARAAALGESYVAIADDATATHWNPAGLGQYPMSPKWFDISIPDQYRPLEDMAVFEGEGTGEDFEHFDVWALTAKGLMKYRNYTWTDFDILPTRADMTLESIIRRHVGLLNVEGDGNIGEIIEQVAQTNNKKPISALDAMQNRIVPALPEDYSNMIDLDSAFINLREAYNKCLIDWEAMSYADELIDKALRDSKINETEADRIIFILAKARLKYLGRSLTIPYNVIFRGKLTSIEASDNYLWVATESALYRYNGDSWQQFTQADGVPSSGINKIKVYDNLVFIYTDSGLAAYDAGRFVTYGPEQGLPKIEAKAAVYINKDVMWAVLGNDLYKFDGVRWRNYLENSSDSLLDAESAYESMMLYNNALEKDTYFAKFNELNADDEKKPIEMPSSSMSLENLNQLVDSMGVISSITAMDSIKAVQEIADSIAMAEAASTAIKLPLTGGFQFEVLDMNADEFGNIWVGTEFGLLRLNGYKWKRYGYREYTVGPKDQSANTKPMVIDTSDMMNDSTVISDSTVVTEEVKKPEGFETVYQIALRRVKGDSTRADRLARQIRIVNHLKSDTLKYGDKIYMYANPSGAAIRQIVIDETNMFFATSQGTIQFDGVWGMYEEQELGHRSTYRIIEKNNNVWFFTKDKIEVLARTVSQITGMHVKLLPGLSIDDVYFEFLGFVSHIKGWGTIGGNVKFLTYGEVIRTDPNGHELGSFYPFEVAVSLSYGTRVTDNLSAGISTKIIYSHLSEQGAGREKGIGKSTAIAIDFGLLYRLTNRLSLGMALTNIGPEMSYIDVSQSDPLPRRLTIGMAWKLIESPYNQVLFTIDANKSLADRDKTILEDFRDVIAAPLIELKGLLFNPFTVGDWSKEFRNVIINTGIEYKYGSFIAFRGGYIHDEEGDVKVATLGIGLSLSLVTVDIAYIPSSADNSPLANQMNVSISANF